MALVRSRAHLLAAAAAGISTMLLSLRAYGTTYTDATGENWGPSYVDLSSVVVTNDATNITFQVNVNPTANLDDPTQEFADYEIGFQSAPGGSTALSTPYSNSMGISTGMNFWIGCFSSTPGAQLYHWNGASWDLTAGFGTAGPFLIVTRTPTGLTISAPMASLGLTTGNQFNFDVWTTFGNPGGQGAYDALDNLSQTPQPFTPVVPYDAATATGSTFSTTTYIVAPPPPPAWQIDGDGDWNTGSNWTGGLAPNAIDAEADLLSAITATHTISTAVPVTLGTLRFNNTNAYVLSGAGSLTFQTSVGSALVDVQAGNHQIMLPISIASNTTFNMAGGTSLLLSGPVTVSAGKSVSQTGTGAVNYQSTVDVQTGGSIAFGNSFHATGLTLEGTSNAVSIAHSGLTPRVLQLDSLSIAAGSKLDLKNNELLTNATLAAVRAQLVANEIVTTSAGGALGYLDLGGGQIEVRFTLAGDTNLDTTVDVGDLGALATNYGATSGKVWSQGDFNLDGAVDVGDLGALATNYGQTLGAGAASPTAVIAGAASVPEPSTLAMYGAGLISWAGRRRARSTRRNANAFLT